MNRKINFVPDNFLSFGVARACLRTRMADTETWEQLSKSVISAPWTASTFNEKQYALLTEFKNGAAKDFIKPDAIDLDLFRWLVARKWDVDAATQMYINHIKWRKLNKVDTILEDFPNSPYYDLLRNYWPDSIDDRHPNKPKAFRTRDGHQFYVDRFSAVDTSILSYFPREALYQHRIWIQEWRAKERFEILRERGEIAATTAISDLGYLSFSHLTGTIMTQVKDAAKMDTDNYPETMRKAFIVNCPTIFTSLWSMVSYLWDEEQKNKMLFIGSDFQKQLFQVVDPKYVPKEFGGTCEWKLPVAGSISKLNLMFPVDRRPWVKVQVSRSATYTNLVEVSRPSIITWHFKVKDYDIGFGVVFSETREGTKKIVVESCKHDSQGMTISGFHEATVPGFYHLVWDNTHSWTRGKDLHYLHDLEDL